MSAPPEPGDRPGTGAPGDPAERRRGRASREGGHVRDYFTNTVEDAAAYERHHGPVYPVPVRRILGELVEDPPSPSEL